MGSPWVFEPWHVQWLGDIAALRVVTAAGVGRYHHRSITNSDSAGDASDSEYVVSHSVAAFSVTALLLGALGGNSGNIDAQWHTLIIHGH